MKNCSSCGVEKPIEEFSKNARSKDGLRSSCKSCVKVSRSSYYLNNKKQVNKKNADYRARNAEAESSRQVSWRKRNKDKTSARDAKRYSENRSQFIIDARARKQNIRGLEKLAPGEWESMVEQCNNICIVTGCFTSPVTKDHVIPLSKGGRHHVSNLQPLCKFHNDSKGVKTTDYRSTEVEDLGPRSSQSANL